MLSCHSPTNRVSKAVGVLLLDNLLDTSELGILLLTGYGSERRVAFANSHFCMLFGLDNTAIQDLEVARLCELCRPALAPSFTPGEMEEGMVAGGPEHVCEFGMGNHGHLFLRQISKAATNPGGEAAGRLLLYRDITLDRRAEEQLAHRQKMESVGTLAGGIAHDFNNILTAVFGYTDALLNDFADNPDATEKLGQIQHSAHRAAELTANLLAFSRKNPHLPQPVDLSHLADSTANMLMFTLPPGIRLEIGAMDPLPMVQADPGQIQQVLTQIIINAREAIIEEGNIRVSTRLGVDSQASKDAPGLRYAVVDIEDTGVGIPPDSVSRIFEPFYTTKGPDKGVGLGLSMVYGVVKQHRGFIEVESAPNAGSRFSVYLPVMNPQPAREITTPPPAPDALKSACVLVVEDEGDIRELAAAALGGMCREVFTAGDGIEALKIFRTHSAEIDLVLLDLTMPGMGGADCYREMCEIRPDVRVMVCSGYAEEMGASDILARGAIGFVSKPYTIETLIRRVAESFVAESKP